MTCTLLSGARTCLWTLIRYNKREDCRHTLQSWKWVSGSGQITRRCMLRFVVWNLCCYILTHFAQSSKIGAVSKGFDAGLANRPFLVIDFRALWRSRLSSRVPKSQKLKNEKWVKLLNELRNCCEEVTWFTERSTVMCIVESSLDAVGHGLKV